ncbi:MAG: sugar ABC transporter substrate-binding protein [Candidatus Thermofonsia Clade 1 bacterium]|uniref:Sugar ABC transporter substrate-binding protein n=1 Tax=Candidatus Thermofonsia Clade 1 bacterium TaxID=2364210 RepID=A0A2M8P403_9CHLR|nr:MAG: sugar ABC transporter substrate-binding protein [Candidatus Thermofonsia Clade 1 bacterium]
MLLSGAKEFLLERLTMTFRKTTALLMCLALVAAFLFSAFGSTVTAQTTLQLWTKFNDQNPQNTQDLWLADTIARYREQTGVQVVNTFQPFDQINAKLNVAVQARGEVPDVSYVDSQQLGFFEQNGVLMDLTDWVKSRPWFSDLDAGALAACTTADGRILCVPAHSAVHFLYFWTDVYPDGVPATTDEFLAKAAELKAANPNAFAFTGKLAEKVAVERFYYNLIVSYGGQIADEEGRATWANDATVKVVEFVRALFANGYAAQESLAPGFDNEQPFMRGEAGAFVAGSYSYVYLTPLTAPDGTKFEGEITGTFDPEALSVGAALKAGKLGIAPQFAAPGSKPASLIVASAWAIPMGARNVEAAKAFIDFQMTTSENVAYSAAYGALPALVSAAQAEEFQTPYWVEVAKIQKEFAVPAPTFADYDKGITLLADAIVRLITNPSLDIMATLQAAQDEYNAGLD